MSAETSPKIRREGCCLFAMVLPAPPDGDTVAAWCGDALRGQDTRVLWFSDAEFETFASRVGIEVKQAEVTFCGALLCRTLDRFGCGMRDLVAPFLADADLPPDWWLSRLSEINFADPAWFSALRAATIAEEVKRIGVRRLVAVAEPEVIEVLAAFSDRCGIEFRGWRARRSRSTFECHVNALAAWGVNLAVEVTCLAGLRRRRAVAPGDAPLLLADFPNNWSGKGATLANRYAGPRLSSEAALAVTVSRHFQRRLRSPGSSARAIQRHRLFTSSPRLTIMESEGRLGNLLRCYFDLGTAIRWRRAVRRAIREGTFVWNGLDLEPVLRRLLADAAIVDLPKNRYLRHCAGRAALMAGAGPAVVPVFELTEGRALVAGAHDGGMTTIGLQHGPLGPTHLWRFVWPAMLQRAARDRSALPDYWAVESSCVAAWLAEAQIPSAEIVVIGAPRASRPTPSFDVETAEDRILVLGEMHAPRHFLGKVMDALAGTGTALVVRPHPATIETIRDWVLGRAEELGLSIALSDASVTLEAELERRRPKITLVGTSGAAVTLAQHGWPVAIVMSNWLPNNNPLLLQSPGDARSEQLFVTSVPSELRAWMRTLLSDEAQLRQYSERCRGVSADLLAASGVEAAKRIATLVDRVGRAAGRPAA